jgi:hypothetical protein
MQAAAQQKACGKKESSSSGSIANFEITKANILPSTVQDTVNCFGIIVPLAEQCYPLGALPIRFWNVYSVCTSSPALIFGKSCHPIFFGKILF